MSIVVIWKGFAFWPSMTRVASEMKLQFMVFEMKGKERDALRGNDGVDAMSASRERREVRTASNSKKKPPTTSSDEHESRRWREGTAGPRDAEIVRGIPRIQNSTARNS